MAAANRNGFINGYQRLLPVTFPSCSTIFFRIGTCFQDFIDQFFVIFTSYFHTFPGFQVYTLLSKADLVPTPGGRRLVGKPLGNEEGFIEAQPSLDYIPFWMGRFLINDSLDFSEDCHFSNTGLL